MSNRIKKRISLTMQQDCEFESEEAFRKYLHEGRPYFYGGGNPAMTFAMPTPTIMREIPL